MAYQTSRRILDRAKPLEMVLTLNSFSGGENTIGEDAALKNNEARIIQNWDALSIGGMERSKGFNEVGDGGVTYSDAPDLLIQHKEGASTRVYLVVEGDVAYLNGSSIDQESAAGFTSGTLCHAVSAGDKLWVTNSTDNLKYDTIAGALTTPASQPASARDRIYYHKFRLIAEGGGVTVYGSKAGTGNWVDADAWSASGDAWSIDLPDPTRGCAPSFPSGNEVTVFTYFQAYSLFNFPNTSYRPIANSRGCAGAYTIAQGDEGIYCYSEYPTKGIFLWNGVEWLDLTTKHDFIDNIDSSKRMFGIYRNRKYYFIYNESGSGVTYPNRLRIYNAKFGRWMERPVNPDVSDNFGYPAILRHTNQELYVASSQKDKLYELETTDNSDEDNDTIALYRTKDFTSKDFLLTTGDRFPADNVRFKLVKIIATYFGIAGNLGVLWNMDRGRNTGSQTFTMTTTAGANINDDFTVNTSSIIALEDLTDKTVTRSFSNKAIGRRVSLDITNSATGSRPKLKSLVIHAIAVDQL